MWSQSSGGHTTEFSNTPFRLIEKKTLDCQFGKQYCKDKPRKSTRTMIQGSRKLDCPAHITIKVYEIFPEYAIPETKVSCNSKKAIKVLKEQKMKQLKLALTNRECTHYQKVFHLSPLRRGSREEPPNWSHCWNSTENAPCNIKKN